MMFFSLIRPLIRWKIQMLLDDGKPPGAIFLWLLKKDNVSWQYYQDMLRLEGRLREKSSIPNRISPNRRAPRHKKRKTHAIAVSAALILLVTGVFFFRPAPEKNELAVHVPVVTPPFTPQHSTPDSSGTDLLILAEQVVPSGVREVLRPALVPIKETYDLGKEQLLEDLGSLPIKPLTDLGRRLYSVHLTENNGGHPLETSPENESIFRWPSVDWLFPSEP